MLNKHPGAQLLRTAGEPPVDIRFGTDQYIQCTSVVPEPDRTLPMFSNLDVPPAVRSYYDNWSVLSVLVGPATYIDVSRPTALSTCSVARDPSPRGGMALRNPGSKRPTSRQKKRSQQSCAGRRLSQSKEWRSHPSNGSSTTLSNAQRSLGACTRGTRLPSRPGNWCRRTR